MKKRSLLKRIAAIAMSAAMVLGMATAAQADTGIDDSKAVTLIIKKTDEQKNPIAGVEFAYQKIGEIGEVVIGTETTTPESVLGYRITNQNVKTVLVSNGLVELKADSQYYDAGEIQKILKEVVDKTDKGDKAKIEAEATNKMPLTGTDGQTTVPEKDGDVLEQGLYLVVEKSAPAGVTAFCDPFIVSLPLYNANGTWEYNVVASPKNTVEGQPVVDKKVVDDDGKEILDPSTLVGETVKFEVTATVPSGAGTLSKFNIVDTMSKGLTFAEPVVVMGYKDETDKVGTNITNLFTTTDTIDEQGKTEILISCKEPDTSLKNVYKKVVVTYSATVNDNALTIDKVNNKVGLDYDNTPGIDTDTDTVEVPVYGYKFTKVAGDNKTGLEGAKFELYSDSDCTKKVQMYDVNGNKIDSISSQEDGTVIFYVKDINTNDTYYLKETQAPNGYTSLKDPIEIKISESTKLVSQINIVNTKGFDLPQTGGAGTIIFTVGGIAIMLGAAFLLIRANKKSKAN